MAEIKERTILTRGMLSVLRRTRTKTDRLMLTKRKIGSGSAKELPNTTNCHCTCEECLVEDGLPCHQACTVKAWFAAKKWQVLETPLISI